MDLRDVLTGALRDAGVRRGDRLGLAVSGGADSTALMHLAASVAADLHVSLHVLHVDHGLREDSPVDARAVVADAERLGIPATVRCVEVRDRRRASIEALARDARYAALSDAADGLRLTLVATAHTLDDQAETVLLRAMRGTGIAGLGGIDPVRGRFVRPLLGVRGQALKDWLIAEGIDWREDPTNADLDRERNWVRAVLLPAMTERREGVAITLARLADLARSDAAALADLATDAYSRVERLAGGVVLPLEVLEGHDAITSRVVLRALREVGATTDASTVDRVLGLRRAGEVVACGGGVDAWRFGDAVAVLPRQPSVPEPLVLPRSGEVAADGWGVRVRVRATDEPSWLWGVMVADDPPLVLRSRRPGDRVVTPAGTRKVADVLRDAKVPRPLRGSVPVLSAGDRALAVVGFSAPPVGSGGSILVEFEPLSQTPAKERWWSSTSLPASS